MFEATKIRADFPILKQKVNGKQLVYFDNGATAQKPNLVIEAIRQYYREENSNIHRGVHYLSQLATEKYEIAREKVKSFINAKSNKEIIFTAGTTGSINLLANVLGKKKIKRGDEILISTMEHHSNIVPWQFLCEEKGAVLKVVNISNTGEFLMDDFKKKLSEKTKIVAITHVSNTLGTINPVKEIVNLSHANGSLVMLDGAQAVPHIKIDVQDLDCDFYAFSAHKMYGPTGVGVLYGKENLLNDLPPYQGGGDMIKTVTFEKTTYNELPHKMEAGTPNIAGGIGLSAAIDYLATIDFKAAANHEQELLAYATLALKKIKGIKIYGEANNKAGVLSFLIEKIHPFDLGTILDQLGIAIRTGHHCTEPLMNFFQIQGTARASFAFYNTFDEVDFFIEGVLKASKMLR